MARVCTAFVHANDESAGIITMMVMMMTTMVMVLLTMMRMMTMMMMVMMMVVMMMMMMVIVVMMMVMMVMVVMMMRVMMIMTMTVDSEGMTTPASMIEWHPSVHRRRTHTNSKHPGSPTSDFKTYPILCPSLLLHCRRPSNPNLTS